MLLPGADNLTDWARRAAPGETLAYARGGLPDGFARSTAPLIDAGVIIPHQKRQGGESLYIARRTSAPFDAALARMRVRRTVNRGCFAPTRRALEKRVFQMLVRCARHARPCPTNREIAAALPGTSAVGISYRIRRLIAGGQIAVIDHSPFGRRVVTILTGPHAGCQTVEAAI